MAKEYSNVFDVTIDASLFLALVEGINPTLGLLPGIAKGRWKWICDQWVVLYPAFKRMASGDENLEKDLINFNTAVTSASLGNTQNPLERNDLYLNFMSFLMNIEITALRLTKEEEDFYKIEMTRISKLASNDFRNMRSLLRSKIVSAASLAGKGDQYGSSIFGGKNVTQSSVSSFSDFVDIESMMKIEDLIEGVIFYFKQNEDRPPNVLQLTQNNIGSGSGFSIVSAYLSSKAVPFKDSLEEMAKAYLGDATKWYELVTINNLQPPYVDEIGTKYLLTAPGGQNNVTINTEAASDIQVGLKLMVGSKTFLEESRIVEKKTTNDDGSMTLVLSGDRNLNTLEPSHDAYVRIYKPGTVNSGSMILIPSDVRSDSPVPVTPSSDRLRRLDKDLLSFGVDFKRNESTGDLEIDGNGNIGMAVGMENVRQAVYWALQTPMSQLPFHPEYGMDLGIGATFMGTESELTIISNLISANVLKDSRFKSCEVASISSYGNGIALKLIVSIGSEGSLLPLSFVV
ncbi:hypothetical protein UFOVP244_172 [uncultured Caudovirales phage]|uniref:Uncharacterized protein n=1 Tax=uncultured Caudovirales phage TaxID=2100421 RepID=A0A6J7WX90_9CAUD|nr:hypothetical protein UFOVP244_172 [uncultured Caudovirales phage]